MSSTDSDACRPLLGKDRNHQSAASENGGEVTLDNLTQMWQAISIHEPGGSNVTRKVVYAEDQ
jgi:hypothetical protein